jgi:hypothetical protein
MNLTDYNTLRYGLQCNAKPADEQVLVAFASELQRSLVATGLFHSIEVGHTDDPDMLLIAMAGFAPDADPVAVADALEDLWPSVGHRYWSMRTATARKGHVELHAASRESSHGRYITLHLVAQAATVPAQRPATESVEVAVVRAPARRRRWARLAGPALAGA